MTPLLLALVAVPVLARRRGARAGEALVLGAVVLGIALLLPLVPVLALGGATERYEVDFATLLIVLATIAWLALADALRARSWARRATLGAGAAAIAFSATAGLAFSVVGYYDGLRAVHPGTYDRLEGFFGFVPTLAARLQGQPVVLEVSPPAGTATPETDLQLAAPGAGEVAIRATVVSGPALPAGSLVAAGVVGPDGRARRVRVTVGRAAVLRASLGGAGLTHVTVRWRTARVFGTAAPLDPATAGVGIVDARVVGWTSQ